MGEACCLPSQVTEHQRQNPCGGHKSWDVNTVLRDPRVTQGWVRDLSRVFKLPYPIRPPSPVCLISLIPTRETRTIPLDRSVETSNSGLTHSFLLEHSWLLALWLNCA